jgi:hypothetical protein
MSEKIDKKESSGISRRDFLKDAGLLAAVSSTALLAACAGESVTQTLTQTKTQTATATTTVTATGAPVTNVTTVTATGAPVTTTTTVTTTAAPTTVTVEPTSVTILNPEGQMEPIPLTPLAPRVTGGLDGKTIYVVSVNFTGTEPFLQELQKMFQEKYPKANVVYKIKEGSYAASDQVLWAEVKAKANAFVMAVGH